MEMLCMEKVGYHYDAFTCSPPSCRLLVLLQVMQTMETGASCCGGQSYDQSGYEVPKQAWESGCFHTAILLGYSRVRGAAAAWTLGASCT